MRLSRPGLAVILCLGNEWICGVNAAPAPHVSSRQSAPDPDSCGLVASAVQDSSRRSTPTVPATLAFDCLQTVPNRKEPAKKLIQSFKAYSQWQSTLPFLKSPPQDYPFAAVDVLGTLDNISSTVDAGGYRSEYDFQLAILELVQSVHDGHYTFMPDIFSVFTFSNRLLADLVSVSRDGVEVPKLYHAAELLEASDSGTGEFPRAVTKINGEDAATVLERRSTLTSFYQDPDAQWNSDFPTYARQDTVNSLAQSLDYTGPSVTLTYDDGTEQTEESIAYVRVESFPSRIETGDDFYDFFLTPSSSGSSLSERAEPAELLEIRQSRVVPISGYPAPVVRDSDADLTSGYFLNGTGYDDVAVLVVSGFQPDESKNIDSIDYMVDFQQTIEGFLAECKQSNKKRLVIDLSANGGGIVAASNELFAQLFPSQQIWRADNIRLAESVRQIGETASSAMQTYVDPDGTFANVEMTSEMRNAVEVIATSGVVDVLMPGNLFAPNGTLLETEAAVLGPVTLLNDSFTAYQHDPQNETSRYYNMTGTGSRTNPPAAVFDPADIVLLMDGTCGSACTLFSYQMLYQFNVKTLAVGGRPRTGAMQSIGGVEGSQLFPLRQIAAAANAAIVLNPDLNVTGSEIAEIAEGYALSRARSLSSPGGVNGKNAFARTNAEMPLQFLYQPANCRVFYTWDMLRQPAETWKRAVDATWTDPDRLCVEGSRVEVVNMAEQPTDPRFNGQAVENGNGNGGDGEDNAAGLVRVDARMVIWTAGLAAVVVGFVGL